MVVFFCSSSGCRSVLHRPKPPLPTRRSSDPAHPPPDMSRGEAAAKLVGIPSLLEPLAGSATVVPVPLDFIRQHLIDLEARHGTNLELALAQASKVRATSFRALRSPSQ